MGNDQRVKFWQRLRVALGLLTAGERRERQRAEIEERMKVILAIPPTRIDAFVARPEASGERARNGSADAARDGEHG